MEIKKGQLYILKKPSIYFAKKHGNPRPVVLIEGRDIEIWPGGWMRQPGNSTCLSYGMRVAAENLPTMGAVYYGKVGALGELFHETELEVFIWPKK